MKVNPVVTPLLTLLAFIVVLCPLAAKGQEGSDSVTYVFPPVTTVGTRFAEPWVRVPLAVSSISQRDMVRGKGYGLDEVLAGVPGVLAQSRYGNQDIRLSIRGFGARGAGARSNAGTTRGLRILVDGFPETEPDGRTSLDLVDLPSAGSVEIVRSNVSSVHGNASGGVISIRSNTGFVRPFTEFQSTAGSYGYHAEAVRAGAMLGAGRFFFSLTNRNADGWRAHSRSSQSLLNTGVVTPMGEGGTLGIYVTGTDNVFRIPGPLSQAQFDSLAQQADSLYIRRDERRHNRIGRIGLSVTHSIDDVHTVAATAFFGAKDIQRSERNTFRDFHRHHIGGSFTYRNTMMLSAAIRNSIVAGVDHAFQGGAAKFRDLVMNPVLLSAHRGTKVIQHKDEGAGHFGAFIQDEVRFGDRVSVLMGARYDNITYTYDNLLDPKLNDSRSFERVTPKVGVSYMLSPAHSVYANIGGGVEVPAGNEVDPVPTFGTDTLRMLNPLLAPIHSTTVEFGTKHLVPLGGTGLDGWLTYDLAFYWLEVHNDIIPYEDGSYFFTAGRTRRMGVEAATQVQLAMGLTVDGAVTLSRNTYVAYTVDSVHFGRAGRFADLGGNAVAGVPGLFYSAGVKFAPPELLGAYLRAGIQGVGRYYADDRNRYDVPSYVVLNASVGIDKLPIGRSGSFIRGYIGMNNVTNRKYAAAAWINPQLNSRGLPVYLEPGLPRNLVGSISVGWEF